MLPDFLVSFAYPILDILVLDLLHVLARGLFPDCQRCALRYLSRLVSNKWQWPSDAGVVFQAQFLLFILETEVKPAHLTLLRLSHGSNVVDAGLSDDISRVLSAVLTSHRLQLADHHGVAPQNTSLLKITLLQIDVRRLWGLGEALALARFILGIPPCRTSCLDPYSFIQEMRGCDLPGQISEWHFFGELVPIFRKRRIRLIGWL